MQNPTLLIDADIYAYKAATVAEQVTDWGDGIWTLHAHQEKAEQAFDSEMQVLREQFNTEKLIVCLTDTVNWRKAVMPTYKDNRKATRKPLLLKHLRTYIEANYKTYMRPTLEADDIMGILMTHPTIVKGDKIIVSADKDMKTIPGFHYYQGTVNEYSEQDANKAHMYQTLVGDNTDGYSGCPGIGPEAARDFLSSPYIVEEYAHTFASGVRKGQCETRWNKRDLRESETLWEGMCSLYRRSGLSEEVALENARVARICRASDYDMNKKEVKLWTPQKLAKA